MLEFFGACAGLFTRIFNAACGLDLFRFFAALLLVELCFGLFLMLQRGLRKM